ncbi:hypothetical protein AAHB64_29460 [Bacillus toyonensis]
MTYDEHGTWSQPGSTISKPWLEENLNYTTRVVDNKKLLWVSLHTEMIGI